MKSFLQGKQSHPGLSLRPPSFLTAPTAVSGGTARPAAQASFHNHAGAAGHAAVEVVKEGDKVVRLIVTCGCGERIEVECLYPTGR